MVDRGVALLDEELDLLRVVGHRVGQGGAKVLAHEVGDERQVERGRAVGGPGQDRAVDERPQRGQGDDAARAPARTSAKSRNLTTPPMPLPPGHRAAAVAAVAVPARRARRPRARSRSRRRRTRYRRPWGWRRSRGRPPERIVMCGISGGRRLRGGTDGAVCRVSRASCRMTAAASRSTRARYSSRWCREGGPPERPRFIGPSRLSATWLLSRSSCKVIGDMLAQSAADVLDPRPRQRGLRPFVPGRIDGQPDDELRDLVRVDERAQRRRRRPRCRGRGGASSAGGRPAPGPSAMATPMRRSPRSMPSARVTAMPRAPG